MLPLLVNIGFQVLFHSPPGVLFTFPSRYYALSVTKSYLALGGGPPCFPPDFPCPAVLWVRLPCFLLRLRGCYPLWLSFPALFAWIPLGFLPARNPKEHALWFGLFPVRSPLLGKSIFLSLPRDTKMFQFSRFASHTYVFGMGYLRFASSGFPHSDISGSLLACSSPERFAAGCVLLRPLTPRHPPCALIRLTYFKRISSLLSLAVISLAFLSSSLCSFQGAILNK